MGLVEVDAGGSDRLPQVGDGIQANNACAVVDVGYVGNAFAYVVDRKSGRRFEWSTLTPLAHGIAVADGSVRGRTMIYQPGWGRIVLDNDMDQGLRTIEAQLEGRDGSKACPPLAVRGCDEGLRNSASTSSAVSEATTEPSVPSTLERRRVP